MHRRKRRVGDRGAVEELSLEIAIRGTSALRYGFQHLSDDQAIRGGLNGKDSGFLFMVIASVLAQEVESAAAAQSEGDTSVGYGAGMLAQSTGSLDPRFKLRIGVNEADAYASQRDDPIQILNAGLKGTGPDIFLVVRKVAQEL